jgi:methionyl-tRNA formyltransferase
MRFAFTASDRYLGIVETFVEAGWTPVKLFTLPTDDNRVFPVTATLNFAAQRGLPIQLSPIQEEDLKTLAEKGCEVLIVASYSFKIPDWTPYLKYAINFHPSPLPVGRGPYPMIRAIQQRLPSWGVACHKLAPAFDSGDILAIEEFPLSATDNHDILDLKIQMANKRLAKRVVNDFQSLWGQSQPQSPSEFWRLWREGDKTINFNSKVGDILTQIDAFGIHEVIAHVNGFKVRVKRALGWVENHENIPGHVIHAFGSNVVVAALDGYIALTEWTAEGPSSAQSKS